MDQHRVLQSIVDTLKGIDAELSLQRKAQEKMLDQLSDYDQPINYSMEIAGLAKQVGHLLTKFDELSKTPAIAEQSKALLDRIEYAAKRGLDGPMHDLRGQVGDLARTKQALLEGMQSERRWDDQATALKRRWYFGIALGATVVALIWWGWARMMGPTPEDVAWAMSHEGQEARELSHLTDLTQFLECSGTEWRTATSERGYKICLTGDRFGWYMRQ